MPDSDAPAAKSGKPNIVVIMADDISWSNIGIYNQGMMAVRTPNLNRMAISTATPVSVFTTVTYG